MNQATRNVAIDGALTYAERGGGFFFCQHGIRRENGHRDSLTLPALSRCQGWSVGNAHFVRRVAFKFEQAMKPGKVGVADEPAAFNAEQFADNVRPQAANVAVSVHNWLFKFQPEDGLIRRKLHAERNKVNEQRDNG